MILYLKHVNRHKVSEVSSRFHQFDCPECSKSHNTVTELRKHLIKAHEVQFPLIAQNRAQNNSVDPVPSTSGLSASGNEAKRRCERPEESISVDEDVIADNVPLEAPIIVNSTSKVPKQNL